MLSNSSDRSGHASKAGRPEASNDAPQRVPPSPATLVGIGGNLGLPTDTPSRLRRTSRWNAVAYWDSLDFDTVDELASPEELAAAQDAAAELGSVASNASPDATEFPPESEPTLRKPTSSPPPPSFDGEEDARTLMRFSDAQQGEIASARAEAGVIYDSMIGETDKAPRSQAGLAVIVALMAIACGGALSFLLAEAFVL